MLRVPRLLCDAEDVGANHRLNLVIDDREFTPEHALNANDPGGEPGVPQNRAPGDGICKGDERRPRRTPVIGITGMCHIHVSMLRRTHDHIIACARQFRGRCDARPAKQQRVVPNTYIFPPRGLFPCGRAYAIGRDPPRAAMAEPCTSSRVARSFFCFNSATRGEPSQAPSGSSSHPRCRWAKGNSAPTSSTIASIASHEAYSAGFTTFFA